MSIRKLARPRRTGRQVLCDPLLDEQGTATKTRKLTATVGYLTLMAFALGAAAVLPGVSALAVPADDTPAANAGSPWHPVAEIKSAAEEYVRLAVGRGDERVVPTAGHLDARLQLGRCDQALDPYLQNPARRAGRVIVGVRCRGNKPWNVYLPVSVAIMEDVVVTARSLAKNHRILPGDLAIERRDVSGLTGGYLSNPSAVLGQTLKRPQARGIVLTSAQLEPEVLVRKGQTVTLTVENEVLAIKMSGKALMNGAANERIRVENTASGRVVEGVVRSSQVVQVDGY